MRAFQVICTALAASSAYGLVPYAFAPTSHVITGSSYGLGYASAPVASYSSGFGSGLSTVVASAAPVATTHYTTGAVQPVSTLHSVNTIQPVTAVHSVNTVQPVTTGVIAHAPAQTVKTHEVHTSSGQQAIHIQDFQAGDKVIRVHEGPQAAPEIAQIAVPGERSHIRVVNHQTGPAHIERTVHRAETQVVDIQKPGRPGARIVQVVRGQNRPPSVEFVEVGGSQHHVYHADSGVASVGGVATSFDSGIATSVVPTGVATHHVAAAPAAITTHHVATPAVTTHHVATPAVSTSFVPTGVAHTAQYIHAPSTYVAGHSYGTGYPFGIKKA